MQQCTRDQLAYYRDSCSAEQCNENRGMYRAVYRILVVASYCVCNNDVCAECYADEQIYDKSDDGGICSHRRYRCGFFCSVAGKVADYRDIRCVEQLLEYRRCRYRQSEPRQLVPYRAVQHVELV